MSLPRYAEYKKSGVTWLGEVPDHWDLRRLGFYFDERREKVSDVEFAALSVTRNGVVPQLENVAKTDDGGNRKKVCAGDFVINGRSDRKGSSGAADMDGSCSLISIVLAPNDGMRIDFAHHLLRSVPFQEEFYRYGKGIVADLWSTNYSEMKNISLAVPPSDEQSAIAVFLDRETGKIDALIAEQEKLLSLLAEKRLATISHAVTRGLNPDAPMKDSGVAWLGEVPVHWNVVCLRRIARNVETGGTPSSESPSGDLEDGLPWYTPGDFGAELVLCDSQKRVALSLVDSGEVKAFPPGSILIVSIGATLGKVGLSGSLASANQQINAVLLNTSMDELFVAYSLSVKSEVMRFLSNASTIGIMNQSKTKEIQVAVPPQVEQVSVASYLDEATARVDLLEVEASRAITLLKERRSALIAAAVTGKIDVRQAV